MSYTNETTHYGIPLPLGSDKTTPMDYNTSMQAVDTALFGAVTGATAGVEKANAVEEALGVTNDNVTALDGRLTLVEGTQTTQGQAIQSNANRIEEVEDDALDMIVAKDEGTAQVATVAVSDGEYFRYNNVLYIATQNIAVGNTIVPNTNCRATNVGTELEAQAEDIAEVKSDLAANVLGTTVDITSYIGNIYTFPSDGYVKLHANTDGTNTCLILGNVLGAGSDNTPRATFEAESKAQSGGDRWASLYVKKGMRFSCSVTGTSAQASTYFVPIQ